MTICYKERELYTTREMVQVEAVIDMSLNWTKNIPSEAFKWTKAV